MAVLEDVRRLSQMDSIFLGDGSLQGAMVGARSRTVWYKGRLQQANDGGWIFRSISMDGTIVGIQLGPIDANWSSNETPGAGLVVQILQPFNATLSFTVLLQQQLPQELT